jgi:cyclophilin family peptidyl-prolyl cis-trans isomerase
VSKPIPFKLWSIQRLVDWKPELDSATLENKPIRNEADNRIPNERGTIAMARTPDPHGATAQFFINTVNNHFLNHKSKSPQG